MNIKRSKSKYNFFTITVLLVVNLTNFGCNSNHTGERVNTDQKVEITNVKVSGSGMDSIKLAQIPIRMQQFVNQKKIAGAVTLVARNGQIASFEAVGFQDLETKTPMSKNTLFRIASLSKPFAAASIMMLQEEGKLNLRDPVEKYLPEFRNMWLVSERNGEKTTLIHPKRKITILDILTHTSGLAQLPADIPINSITEYTLLISQRPLEFEPGTRLEYSGSGITAAARIVEVISGQPYDQFLSKRIFEPLGMRNTFFSPPKESLRRVATLYHPGVDSCVEAIEPPDWWRFPRPEGGLFSTAIDMYIWMQTFINMGIYKGTRILNEKSVIEMTKIQTGELKFTDEISFGLAFRIVHNSSGVGAMLSKGSFGHGGAFGTQSWADSTNKTIYIQMIQRQGFGNGDHSEIRNVFQKIAAEANIE